MNKTRIVTTATLALALLVPVHAGDSVCTWHGTPSLESPAVTHLRSLEDAIRTPARLAIDTEGNLYLTDSSTGQVQIRDVYGRLTRTIGPLSSPLAVAVAPSGEIYVGELETGSVTVFDSLGQPRGKLGEGDGEFLGPNDIAVGREPHHERVYVADAEAHRIRVYSTDRDHLFDFGEKGPEAGQFDFPAAVHVAPNGEVFVGDQNNDRVQVFDRDGNFLRCFGGNGGSFGSRFGRVLGLAADSEGRVYVADGFQGQIGVFDPQGFLLGTIGSFGSGPGQLRTPMGLAVDPGNRLFVASVNNGRVELFGLDEFDDPHAVPAVVTLQPGLRGGRFWYRRPLTVDIEIDGVPLDTVETNSITANGIPALEGSVNLGDHDEDGRPDLRVRFNAGEVLGALPPASGAGASPTVQVEGRLEDGRLFVGSASVDSPPRRRPARRSAGTPSRRR